jgi:hypothetical protein
MLDANDRYLVEEIGMMDTQLKHERSIVGESFVSSCWHLVMWVRPTC